MYSIHNGFQKGKLATVRLTFVVESWLCLTKCLMCFTIIAEICSFDLIITSAKSCLHIIIFGTFKI